MLEYTATSHLLKLLQPLFLWCAKNSFNCHRKVVGFQPPQLNKISVVIRGTSTPVHNCAGSNWAGFANSETLKKGWALKNSLACEIPGLVNIQKTMENHHAIHGKQMAIFNSYVSHYQRVLSLVVPQKNSRIASWVVWKRKTPAVWWL